MITNLHHSMVERDSICCFLMNAEEEIIGNDVERDAS